MLDRYAGHIRRRTLLDMKGAGGRPPEVTETMGALPAGEMAALESLLYNDRAGGEA